MTRDLKLLALVGLLCAPLPALAQTEGSSTAADQPAAEGEQPAATGADLPGALSMGQTETTDGVGTPYVKEVTGDWTIQCVRAPEGQEDPCEIFQLLKDGSGNPVSEMRIFALPAGGQAVAGATIVTPLETLLTEPIRLSVDGGAAKRYPFSWCSQIGCVSRIGFTQADVDGFKRGAKGTLTIVPVAAPDQKVNLSISLTGFTAAFDQLKAPQPPQQ
ncbi:MAG: invasion associated locus B family protein [Brevirhabdus sp.]